MFLNRAEMLVFPIRRSECFQDQNVWLKNRIIILKALEQLNDMYVVFIMS